MESGSFLSHVWLQPYTLAAPSVVGIWRHQCFSRRHSRDWIETRIATVAILAAWHNIEILWKSHYYYPKAWSADCKSQIFHEELGNMSQRSLVFCFSRGFRFPCQNGRVWWVNHLQMGHFPWLCYIPRRDMLLHDFPWGLLGQAFHETGLSVTFPALGVGRGATAVGPDGGFGLDLETPRMERWRKIFWFEGFSGMGKKGHLEEWKWAVSALQIGKSKLWSQSRGRLQRC